VRELRGLRYNPQTLEVLYNEFDRRRDEMIDEEAAEFFRAHPKSRVQPSLLVETGLVISNSASEPALSRRRGATVTLSPIKARVVAPKTSGFENAQTGIDRCICSRNRRSVLHMAISSLLKVLPRLSDEATP